MQEPFLKAHLGKRVNVYLISGIRLVGVLKSFDQFTLMLLDHEGNEQVVFKRAVTTVGPDSGRPGERTTVYQRHRRGSADEASDA